MNTYISEMIDCPLCKSSEYLIYIKDVKELYNNMDEYFNIVKCQECGHYFTNPRPTKETISYFYPDSAGYYNPKVYIQPDSLSFEIFKSILNQYYGYSLRVKKLFGLDSLVYFLKKRYFETTHIPKFVESGKLLGIGCSYGTYLAKMKSFGWDVYGTEINSKAVSFAKEKQGLQNVQNIFFEDASLEDEFYDVVNMNMVLEHVYEPKTTLNKIYSALKGNGQLMISIPDISGFEAKLHKEFAYTLQVPEHLQHFTPKTIKNLLEESGFEVIKIVHQNNDRDFVAPFGYKKNKLLFKIFHNKIIRGTFVRGFIEFMAMIGKTSRMSIYARKK